MSTEQDPAWPTLQQAIAQAEQTGGLVGVAIRAPNGASFGHRDTRQFRAASTVKVPLMITLLQQVEQGMFSLDDPFTITAADKSAGSGVILHLHDGLILTYHDLLYLMISISDNTATNILIDRAGMAEVNATMQAIGMTNSTLGRKMRGQPSQDSAAENWATPRDYITAIDTAIAGTVLNAQSRATARQMLEWQQNPRRIARYLPTLPDLTWGSKTGSLTGVSNDVGFISAATGTMLLSIFTENLASPHIAEQTIGLISRAAIIDTGLLAPLPSE